MPFIYVGIHSDSAKTEKNPSLEVVRDGQKVGLAFKNLHLSCWNIEKAMSTDISSDGEEKDSEDEDVQLNNVCTVEGPEEDELAKSHGSG